MTSTELSEKYNEIENEISNAFWDIVGEGVNFIDNSLPNWTIEDLDNLDDLSEHFYSMWILDAHSGQETLVYVIEILESRLNCLIDITGETQLVRLDQAMYPLEIIGLIKRMEELRT